MAVSYRHSRSIVAEWQSFVGEKLEDLGRRQAPDKGEVQPTPAFRLLRVGAELCVNEEHPAWLSGRYCIFLFLLFNATLTLLPIDLAQCPDHFPTFAIQELV